MWRALFLAIGVTLCLMGLESLVLDHAVVARDGFLADRKAAAAEPGFDDFGYEIRNVPETQKIEPPEWAPWSLLSSGAVVLLYSLVTPRGGE